MMGFVLSIIFILFSTAVLAVEETKTVLRLDYGYGRFISDKVEKYSAEPKGNSFNIEFGTKIRYIEFGFIFKNVDFKSDIIHDQIANQIEHKGYTVGVGMNLFLNTHIHLKVGYTLNKYKQTLKTPLSLNSTEAVNNLYGLEGNGSSVKPFYGIGYDIFGAKFFDCYASLTHYALGSGKSYSTAQLGVRFYFNLGMGDFVSGQP